MRRILVPGLLGLICTLSAASTDRERAVTDRAQEASAGGDPGEAARILAAALPSVDDPAGRSRLQCQLGAALLADGAPQRALDVLARVPRDAACGPRAAWLRVEALERTDRQVEAAALAEELGLLSAGDDRDGQAAESVAALARRLVADPDRGLHEGLRLFELALGLRTSGERRAALAREMYTAWAPDRTFHTTALCSAFRAQLHDQEDTTARLRAVETCSADWALIAEGLPTGADREWAVAGHLGEPVARALARERASALRADPAWLDVLADSWAEAESLDARRPWRALDTPDSHRAAVAQAARAGRWSQVDEEAGQWLGRWANDPHRSEVAALQATALLALARAAGDPATALGRYDSLVRLHPTDPAAAQASWEAGLVARAAGRPDEARRRWEATRAAFPETEPSQEALRSLVRLTAFDEGHAEQALAMLRAEAEGDWVATGELSRLREPDLALSSDGAARGVPVVHLVTRNVDRVELRLHRIDPLAWVRAGHSLSELETLDVAAIAPDESWTVPVPDARPLVDRTFDAPVKVPGPGLYTVTAASQTEEARALVLVSDVRVVTRTVGRDTAVAVFDDRNRPVQGARVWLVDDEVVEGRTDATGLFVARDRDLDPTVLVEKGGNWGLVPASGGHSAPEQATALSASAELDRSVYLPGDHVGLRVVARAGGEVVPGTWTLWLASQGRTLPPVTADTDARGAVQVDLELPADAPTWRSPHPSRRDWTVMGLAPGETSPRVLSGFKVAARDTAAFSFWSAWDGDALQVHVRDPDDVPAVHAAVATDLAVATTDAAGIARFAGPGPHVPWSTSVNLLGTDARSRTVTRTSEPQRVAVVVAESTLRPGEPARLTLDGEGEVDVTVFRRLDPPPDASAPRDPWVPVVDTELRGWHRELGPGEPLLDGLREQVSTQRLALDGVLDLSLPALPEGRYEVVATTADGRAFASAGLWVDADALRITGGRDVGAGDVLRLVPEGGAALVTAEGAGLLWAGVRAPGRPAEVEVDARWRGPVVLAATGADGGHHVRRIDADPNPRVTVVTERDGDGFVARAVVRDRAGRPVDAEVSFTAWDPRIAGYHGVPPALAADAVWSSEVAATTWGDGGPLHDGAEGEPIAPSLLAENELRRERELARSADRSGGLSDNALAEAMLGDVPIEYGSLGATGFGSGGGYARGEGGIGTVGGAPIVLGTDEPPLPGVRERVVWRVEATVDGVAKVRFAAPPAALQLRATAVTREGIGSDTVALDADDRVRMVVRQADPGSVEDRARPVVTVVNGTETPSAATLSIGAEVVELTLAAGEARRVVATTEVPAGGTVAIALRAGAVNDQQTFSLPLSEGAPAAEGPVTFVAAGPKALQAVVMRGGPSPAWTDRQWADAGRAAVALWQTHPDDDLARWVRQVRGHLRLGDGLASAAVASFLAEASQAGVVVVSRPELDEALAAVQVEGSVVDRLRATIALAEGGRPPAADAVAALRTAVTDDAEERRWLGHLLRLMRLPGAPPLEVPAAPPLPGDDQLVDWVVAHAADPVGASRVAGREVPNGVVVGFVGDVAVTGPALVWQGTGIVGGEMGLTLARVPAGPSGAAFPRSGAAGTGSCDPCRLQLDEGLLDPEQRLQSTPALVSLNSRSSLWRARLPGSFLLGGAETSVGLARAVPVVVDPVDPTPVPPGIALIVAKDWHVAGVRAVLPAPSEEIPAGMHAQLVFDDALLGSDDAAVAAAFRSLAAAAPSTTLPMEDAVRAARALRATGDVVSATALWREITDQAFTDEVAKLAGMEERVGLLTAVQRTREAALRYPLGRAVGEVSYLLPGRLLALADAGLPPGAIAAGITPTDVRLTAAAWDREFLASSPDHDRATAAGLRLGRTLLQLHAPETAARWARRVREAHPADHLVDALLFLEAVARTEAGEAEAAEPLLRSLADDLFPDGGGPPLPSHHADDARLALARLDEARGRWDAAAARYRSIASSEATIALEVLAARRIDAPALVRLAPGERSAVPVEVEGVDRVGLRVYRVDLRTLFLRDGGLLGVRDLAVDGVSPVWTGERSLNAGPFPERHALQLPLEGTGAWLVQLDADGARATSLVVRSDLALDVEDAAGQRRVDVRRGGRPAAGVEVRALLGGRVYPEVTDVRGVATVPAGAAILAWDGEAVAFTDPDAPAVSSTGASGVVPITSPVDVVDRRLQHEQGTDSGTWERLRRAGTGNVTLGSQQARSR
jgi:hypothetical protein